MTSFKQYLNETDTSKSTTEESNFNENKDKSVGDVFTVKGEDGGIILKMDNESILVLDENRHYKLMFEYFKNKRTTLLMLDKKSSEVLKKHL